MLIFTKHIEEAPHQQGAMVNRLQGKQNSSR